MSAEAILLAAVDLGSNSFRLEVARSDTAGIRPLKSVKETVRLGSGLDEQAVLDAAAMQRGWDCLSRFRAALQDHDRLRLRAVATQTLRAARNRDAFLARAAELLGHPVAVIDGREEARLVYRGVTQLLPPSDERRLVVDIGGGSTELILGRGATIAYMASFPVGSVSWSLRHFPAGDFSLGAFQQAEAAARSALASALRHCSSANWDIAYGSAGTAGALVGVLQAAGHAADVIEADSLDWLREQLLHARHASRLLMPGLQEQHRAVIGGGISVMRAVLGLLQIRRLQIAQGGLCLGVLAELREQLAPPTAR